MMRVALIGFGNVGQGLAEILVERGDMLRTDYGLDVRLVAVVTRSRGSLVRLAGLDPGALLGAARGGHLGGYPDADGLARTWDANQVAAELDAVDVLIEASPSNFETGLPALEHARLALAMGKHVVLANKGPVALALPDLRQRALTAKVQLRYEATVMAGTPTLALAQTALRGCRVRAVRGILNGTTNFILTRMETGLPYEDALAEAQRAGYAETDPTDDVDGWDAAGKLLILQGTLFGRHADLNTLSVEGITQLTPAHVRAATESNTRWKLVAEATPDGGSVRPQRLPLTDPLAGVGGVTNAVTLSTDLLGDVTIIGPGAGRRETGFALLADLLAIADADPRLRVAFG